MKKIIAKFPLDDGRAASLASVLTASTEMVRALCKGTGELTSSLVVVKAYANSEGAELASADLQEETLTDGSKVYNLILYFV